MGDGELASARRRQGLWRQGQLWRGFRRERRLYTVAYDGQIRRYGAGGRLEAKAQDARRDGAFQHRRASRWDEACRGLRRHNGGGGLRCAHAKAALRRRYQRDFGRRSQHMSPGPPMARGFMRADDIGTTARPAGDLARMRAGAAAAKRRCRKTPSCSFCPAAMASRRGRPIPPSGLWRRMAANASGRRASPPICATSSATPSRSPPMASASASGLGYGEADARAVRSRRVRSSRRAEAVRRPRRAETWRPRRQRLGEQHRAEAERQAHRARKL